MKRFAKWFRAASSAEVRPEAGDVPEDEAPLDLSAPDFLADPYPVYARLRAKAPVAGVASGGVLLTRHSDVMSALSDGRLGNAPSRFSVLAGRNREKYPAAALAAHIPPFLDMPEHRLPRQALSRAFFRVFEGFGPVVAQEAARAVDGFAPGRGELISQISSPFALRCMARFIGLEPDLATLKAVTRAFFHLFAPISDPETFRQTNASLVEARDLVAGALASRKHAPGGDLLSALSAFQGEHPELHDAQIVDNALLVLADGVENIEAGAASLLHLFAAEGCLDALADGGLPAGIAVREGLRLQTPGQILPRVCREAFDLHGTALDEGMPVFLALGSANRDETAFEAPDSFRPGRDEQALTFGMGRHRCIGEPLAVLQLSTLLDALAKARIRPADPRAPMRYQPRFGHRWPKALDVVRG